MDKVWIGLVFITLGVAYGSLAVDDIYNYTLGWLVRNNWVKPPPKPDKDDLKSILGRKPTIIVYASVLILIGMFILWNRSR